MMWPDIGSRLLLIRISRICIFVAALLMFAQTSVAQVEITVRVIDADTGKPLRGIGVNVDAWDKNEGRQQPPPPGVIQIERNRQIVTTDKEGKGIFHLYNRPGLITLYIFSSDLRGCSSDRRFSIEEVLRSGLVAGYSSTPKWCGQLKVHATVKPGEVVIFDKKLTKWDRIRQEIP